MASDLSPSAESYLRHLVEDGIYNSVQEALESILRDHASSDLERTLGMSREEIRKAIDAAEASGDCEAWEPAEERLKAYKNAAH